MFQKIKSFCHKHVKKAKAVVAASVVSAMSVICGVVAFAEEPAGASNVRDQLKTSATSVASDIMGTITDILPIALPIMGAMLVVGIGIAIVRKVTKKSSAG